MNISMRATSRRIALVAFAGAIFVPITSQSADINVTGTWTVSIESSVQSRETTMKLKQDGKNIIGTLSGANGADIPITGSIAGDRISFSYPLNGLRIQTQGASAAASGAPTVLMLRYEGTVADNLITAKANNPLSGDILIKAKKQ